MLAIIMNFNFNVPAFGKICYCFNVSMKPFKPLFLCWPNIAFIEFSIRVKLISHISHLYSFLVSDDLNLTFLQKIQLPSPYTPELLRKQNYKAARNILSD